MRAKVEEITHLTDVFSARHLNDEYAQLCRYLMFALCRKPPSPLTKGYFQLLRVQHYLEDLSGQPIDLGTEKALREHLREPVLKDTICVF